MKDINFNHTLLSDEVLHKIAVKREFKERSELTEEIVSSRPGFIESWSLFIFLALLVLLIAVAWFIKYPDIIQTQAKLTSINAPKQVISLISGKLIQLKVREGVRVKQDEVLGFIESTAEHEEIFKLGRNISVAQNLLDSNLPQNLNVIFHDGYSRLGELQQSYQTLEQAYLNFKNYFPNGFYSKKKAMLFKDIDNLDKLNENLVKEQSLEQQDLGLAQKTFDANESLKNDKVISDFDYRTEKSKLINKKLTLPQIEIGIISNESQRNDKLKEIWELENTIAQQKDIFQQALNTFRSELEDWKKKYVLSAPIDGKVSFASFVQENQQLQPNQTICYINPANSEYFAQVYIPQVNFGKVALGQNVLLKFNSYPFQEYGYIKGRINFISHIPSDSGYLSRIDLVNGLNTTYKKQVQYREGLTADAEIVTKDLRLLQRFYYNIIQQIKR